ncbi:MAG: exonuclease domain-containing protein [Bdellovibrionales bacterium]|jgi:DNA polymerase-3 subunit epsilon|nr:exonuclease domain-containing protein [Bdellovibrionales bacterium]
MPLTSLFNKGGNRPREIVLDVETTGLFTHEGHRLVEIAAVEMVGGRVTGREFYALVNPQRDIPEDVSKIHGITNEKVKDKPPFAAVAAQLRRFIGDSPVVITCRTHEGYTLDMAFLNKELTEAGQRAVPEKQWLNVRRWSETMFGDKGASLDKVLDRYDVSRKERDEKGHSAILDARLLSEIYPRLVRDYMKFTAGAEQASAQKNDSAVNSSNNGPAR